MAEEAQPTTQPVPERWTNRRIIFLAIVVAIIFYAIFNLPPTLHYLLVRARQTLILLILSIALTYLLAPAVDLLMRIPVRIERRTKRTVAALIALVVFTVLLVVLVAVIITPLTQEMGKTLNTVTQWVQTNFATGLDPLIERTVGQLPEPYRSEALEQIDALEEQFSGPGLAETVRKWGGRILQWQLNLIASVVSGGGYLFALLIVPVFAFYFLTDATTIRNGIATFVPTEARPRYHEMLHDMDVVIRGYVRTVVIISVLTGIATAFTLYFAGVRVFITFGILAGIANMVPVVGGIVAVVLIAAITLMTVGLKVTIVVLLIYGGIQLVTDRVITPKLLAEGAQLHPVAVIVGLLVGAEFFGMIGVFVAVPVLAAARVALLHYRAYVSEDLHGRELDDLLGRERACEKGPSTPPSADAAPPSETESTTAADNDAPDEEEAVDGDA